MATPAVTSDRSPTRVRAAGILLSLTLLAMGLLAGPASANQSVIAGNASYRDCTNTGLAGCVPRGTIRSGTAAKMHCWIDDSWESGRYRSNRWFFVTAGGVRAFVHSSFVDRQTSTPHCGSHRGVAASRWAAMQIGETVPGNDEKNGNANMDRWSGWCYVLASDAHILGHGRAPVRLGSAKAAYQWYADRGRISTNLDPGAIEIGAIVFWTGGQFGHAAIYVGQGAVASTQGNGTGFPPNARLPLNNFAGRPAGWVSPHSI